MLKEPYLWEKSTIQTFKYLNAADKYTDLI